MSITPQREVRRLSQDEFRELSYGVMGHVFEIHKEFGRFFDEQIYKRELARRLPSATLEFPVYVSYDCFATEYHLDVLVADGGAFEFKVVESLGPRHRGQLYNYLLLLDLAHGKLINVRGESVEHEFVNSTIRPADRKSFEVVTERWDCSFGRGAFVRDTLINLLRDWGTGLELGLYETALSYFLGGESQVVRDVNVRSGGALLGQQKMRLAEDDVAFRLTAFDSEQESFEIHARKLLKHVDLRAIFWVNIGLHRVTFTTIQ
jgi:GxxExxY protein